MAGEDGNTQKNRMEFEVTPPRLGSSGAAPATSRSLFDVMQRPADIDDFRYAGTAGAGESVADS